MYEEKGAAQLIYAAAGSGYVTTRETLCASPMDLGSLAPSGHTFAACGPAPPSEPPVPVSGGGLRLPDLWVIPVLSPLPMGARHQGTRPVGGCSQTDFILKQGGSDAFSMFIINTFYFPQQMLQPNHKHLRWAST